jgi:hypothetical protein
MAMQPDALKLLCGMAVLALAGCASTIGQDGSTVSLVCQQQAREAASQPPFPKALRDGKHGQEFQQGIRDAQMSRSCQQEVDSHVEITFKPTHGS